MLQNWELFLDGTEVKPPTELYTGCSCEKAVQTGASEARVKKSSIQSLIPSGFIRGLSTKESQRVFIRSNLQIFAWTQSNQLGAIQVGYPLSRKHNNRKRKLSWAKSSDNSDGMHSWNSVKKNFWLTKLSRSNNKAKQQWQQKKMQLNFGTSQPLLHHWWSKTDTDPARSNNWGYPV